MNKPKLTDDCKIVENVKTRLTTLKKSNQKFPVDLKKNDKMGKAIGIALHVEQNLKYFEESKLVQNRR